jgi:hypothetical protein
MKVQAVFLSVLLLACTATSEKGIIIHLSKLTETDTNSMDSYKKDFFLVTLPPESKEEFKKQMIEFANVNVNKSDTFDSRILIFVKDKNYDFFDKRKSYLEEENQDLNDSDFLGRVIIDNQPSVPKYDITIYSGPRRFYR